MEYVLKQKNIGSFYVCLSAYLNRNGIEIYKASLNRKYGSCDIYHCLRESMSGDKKTTTQSYYNYCRKAKEETR